MTSLEEDLESYAAACRRKATSLREDATRKRAEAKGSTDEADQLEANARRVDAMLAAEEDGRSLGDNPRGLEGALTVHVEVPEGQSSVDVSTKVLAALRGAGLGLTRI